MSTNFEYYLYRFIEYCIEGDDDGWSNDFKYKSSDFYEYDFGGGYYHSLLMVLLNVN